MSDKVCTSFQLCGVYWLFGWPHDIRNSHRPMQLIQQRVYSTPCAVLTLAWLCNVGPTMVCCLVTVAGLTTLRSRKRAANQAQTNFMWTVSVNVTLPVLVHWLIFGFNADVGLTAVYGFIAVYLRLNFASVTVTFWGCALSRTDTS